MSTRSEHRLPLHFKDELLPTLVAALGERQDADKPKAVVRPRELRSAWAVCMPILVVALGLALVVPLVFPAGPGGAEPAAAAVLHRLALRAAQQPSTPAPQPGQYLYTRSESTSIGLYVVGDGTTFFFSQPSIRESWIGPDGSGRILSRAGAVTFPSESDRATWEAAGSPDLYEGIHEDDRFGAGELLYRDYRDIPTDPGQLLELIEDRDLIGGPPGDWETFAIIGDLLRETTTSPKVRAALYQVAADLPGVELVGRVVDAAGRPGVGVAFTHERSDAPSRLELIFDARTAELLGENDVLVRDSTVDVQSGGPGAIYGGVGPTGTRTFTTTYLVSGVVDSTSESL